MKNKIYISVSCSDRMPKKDGVYIVRTKLGLIKTSCFKNGGFVATKIGGDEDKITSYIEYWLEEIELPSKEEIENMAEEFAFPNSVKSGANYILNKLKGE